MGASRAATPLLQNNGSLNKNNEMTFGEKSQLQMESFGGKETKSAKQPF